MNKKSLFLGILLLSYFQPLYSAIASESPISGSSSILSSSENPILNTNSDPLSNMHNVDINNTTNDHLTNTKKDNEESINDESNLNKSDSESKDNLEKSIEEKTSNSETVSSTTETSDNSAETNNKVNEDQMVKPPEKAQVNKMAASTGTWGTATYNWVSDGRLIVMGGSLQRADLAPWKGSSPDIKPEEIKSINFLMKTVSPENSDSLFSNLTNLSTIENLKNLNTENSTNMQSMFANTPSLTSLDLSSFNTNKVKNMNSMFANIPSLTNLDLSSFNTSSVTDMTDMFKDTTKLQSLKLGQNFKFIGSNANLPSPPITDQYSGKWQNIGSGTKDSPKGVNIWSSTQFMSNYTGSKDADTYVWQPAGVGLWGTAPYQWDASSGVLTVGAGDLQQVNLAPYVNGTIKRNDIKKIIFTGSVIAPVDSSSFFQSLYNLSNIDGLTNLDTSNVIDMNSMFANIGVTSLDLSKFDTSKVKNMGAMFYGIKKLTQLDLSSFNTSNTEDMYAMFYNLYALTKLDFSNKFDTSKVNDMEYMFYGNRLMTSLDLSTFNTSKVTNMAYMFSNTTNLQLLKLGKGFRFAASNTDLPEPPNNDKIAGKWRNLGSGDQKKPLGKNLWTSRELMTNYNGETDADTYVWQPTGISIDLVSENFSFPNVQISGKKQTVEPTEKAKLSLTDALPKNYSGTQLLVSYETPDDEWQKTGFSLKIKPSTTQTYIQTAEVQVSPDATPIITQFDESKKQGGTIVDLDLSPELTVPQSLTAKNYSTTIVWTIQQGPK